MVAHTVNNEDWNKSFLLMQRNNEVKYKNDSKYVHKDQMIAIKKSIRHEKQKRHKVSCLLQIRVNNLRLNIEIRP